MKYVFYVYININSFGFKFDCKWSKKEKIYENTGYYPTYHSSYETFGLIDKFVDPGFKAFKAISIVTAEMIRRLTSLSVLPFNCRYYARELQASLNSFENEHGLYLKKLNLNLNSLKMAVANFSSVANKFSERLANVDKTRYLH